ncbi:MAG: YfiR family protein [Geminicoccaceae bacterium]
MIAFIAGRMFAGRSRKTLVDGLATIRYLAAVMIMIPASLAHAEPTEAQIKAAYLYNFAKFVEWPDTSSAGRFLICVDGDETIVDAAAALDGKSVAGLRVEVIDVDTVAAVADCRIVLLDQGWGDVFRPTDIHRGGLLTVGSGIEFAEEGGIIGLFYSDRKLRFAINIDAVADAGLKVNSKLLNLAHIVRQP